MAATDDSTLNLLRQRDPDLLLKVFREVNPYLFKILASHNIFGSDAEDLVQSVWLTFFEQLDKFEGRSQIKVYAAGILLNKIRETHRHTSRHLLEEDSEKLVAQSFDQDGWWVTKPGDPSAIFRDKEILRHIQECLEDLTSRQKEAFILREMNDQKVEEICNILQISLTHLSVLIFRAKEKLRKCLNGRAVGTEA